MERGTNPRLLLCTLQIYTTLGNGIALQEKSEEWSERWGKGGRTPRTSLHIANLHHTSQWHSSSGGKGGKVMERGTNPRTLLCALQIYTTLVNGIALQGERGERGTNPRTLLLDLQCAKKCAGFVPLSPTVPTIPHFFPEELCHCLVWCRFAMCKEVCGGSSPFPLFPPEELCH